MDNMLGLSPGGFDYNHILPLSASIVPRRSGSEDAGNITED